MNSWALQVLLLMLESVLHLIHSRLQDHRLLRLLLHLRISHWQPHLEGNMFHQFVNPK